MKATGKTPRNNCDGEKKKDGRPDRRPPMPPGDVFFLREQISQSKGLVSIDRSEVLL